MLQVKDIMHTKKKMPIVSDNANMKSVIIEMTKKSFGHVGVKNKKSELIGVITDGDLRRNINNHLIESKAKMIMTQRPKLVDQNILVIDALNIMNKNKITCLFVVDKEKNKSPIGIVHIHDCIRYVN
jgi:arabinose-5-phosphate isomerase